MAKFGGFGGGMNMQAMVKQAQKMQQDMAKLQAELEEREYTVSSGGGVVEIVISGKKELKSISIKPEVVDPEDIEMLQDLILAAVNEAIRTVEETAASEMEKITGQMAIPGLF